MVKKQPRFCKESTLQRVTGVTTACSCLIFISRQCNLTVNYLLIKFISWIGVYISSVVGLNVFGAFKS